MSKSKPDFFSLIMFLAVIVGPVTYFLYLVSQAQPPRRLTATELCTSVRGEDIPAWCAR